MLELLIVFILLTALFFILYWAYKTWKPTNSTTSILIPIDWKEIGQTILAFLLLILRGIGAILKIIVNFLWEVLVDDRKRKEQLDQMNEEWNKQIFHRNMQLDYEKFANAVFACAKSNYRKCGLDCPHQLEDVFADENLQVSKSGGMVIFRFAINVASSEDMYVGGMKKQDKPGVDTEKVEKVFRIELTKFANRRGYQIMGDIRADLIANGKVLITASDVRYIF